jgi:hypothetical protein
MIRRWLQRRRCMHHNRHTGQTWIKDMLIDLGRAKLVWCDRCGRYF